MYLAKPAMFRGSVISRSSLVFRVMGHQLKPALVNSQSGACRVISSLSS